MTFISRKFALQVSDRLVSTAGRPTDPVSNKAVVFRARDGLVTSSFTGLARIGNLSSDEWIARCAVGMNEWPNRRFGTWHHRRKHWPTVSEYIHTLRTELAVAFERDVRPEARQYGLAILTAGWQWRPNATRRRPVMFVTERTSSPAIQLRSLFPRHGYRQFVWAIVPSSNPLHQSEIDAMQKEFEAGACENPGDVLRQFVTLIRSAAARRPGTIGPHCMAVYLRPSGGEIIFIPEDSMTTSQPTPIETAVPGMPPPVFYFSSVKPGSANQMAPAGMAYSPWIIPGYALVMSPLLIKGPPVAVGEGRKRLRISTAPLDQAIDKVNGYP